MAKRKRLVLVLSAAACLVLAALVYLQHHWLIETWDLYRLTRAKAGEEKEVIERLALVGGERSVARLLHAAREMPHGDASWALAAILVRIQTSQRLAGLKGLLELLETRAGEPPPAALCQALRHVGARCPDCLPVFLDVFRWKDFAAWKIATGVFLEHSNHPSARGLIESASPEELVRFFLPACLPPQELHLLPGRDLPDPPFQKALDVAAAMSSHVDPCVRAVAMSFQVFRGRTPGNEFEYDPKPVQAAFAGDPSPLVKMAAIRLAGFLGARPDNIDVGRILFTEEDPALLADAIRARTVWTGAGGGGGRVRAVGRLRLRMDPPPAGDPAALERGGAREAAADPE